jgi:hypothetical protein
MLAHRHLVSKVAEFLQSKGDTPSSKMGADVMSRVFYPAPNGGQAQNGCRRYNDRGPLNGHGPGRQGPQGRGPGPPGSDGYLEGLGPPGSY